MSFLQSAESSDGHDPSPCAEPTLSPKPSKLDAITSAIMHFPRQLFGDTAASSSPPPSAASTANTHQSTMHLSIPPPLASSSADRTEAESGSASAGASRTASRSLDGESFARQCHDVMERAQHLLRCQEEHARLVAQVQESMMTTTTTTTTATPTSNRTARAAWHMQPNGAPEHVSHATTTMMSTPEPTRPSRRRSRSTSSTSKSPSHTSARVSPTRRRGQTAEQAKSTSQPMRRKVRLSEETPSPVQYPPAPHPTPAHVVGSNEGAGSALAAAVATARMDEKTRMTDHTPTRTCANAAVTAAAVDAAGTEESAGESEGCEAATTTADAHSSPARLSSSRDDANAGTAKIALGHDATEAMQQRATEQSEAVSPRRRSWRDVLRSLSPRLRRSGSHAAVREVDAATGCASVSQENNKSNSNNNNNSSSSDSNTFEDGACAMNHSDCLNKARSSADNSHAQDDDPNKRGMNEDDDDARNSSSHDPDGTDANENAAEQRESSTMCDSEQTPERRSGGSAVTRRIRQLYDTLRQLTPHRGGGGNSDSGRAAGTTSDSSPPSQFIPAGVCEETSLSAEIDALGTPHPVRKSVQFASAGKLESVTPTKVPSSSSASCPTLSSAHDASTTLPTVGSNAAVQHAEVNDTLRARTDSVLPTVKATRKRHRRSHATAETPSVPVTLAVDGASLPEKMNKTAAQQKQKPIAKAAKKDAHAKGNKATASPEHQEMLHLVRTLSVKKSLEQFSRAKLQRFLHAEGVLCHSPARTKRALLDEARALAGLK